MKINGDYIVREIIVQAEGDNDCEEEDAIRCAEDYIEKNLILDQVTGRWILSDTKRLNYQTVSVYFSQ